MSSFSMGRWFDIDYIYSSSKETHGGSNAPRALPPVRPPPATGGGGVGGGLCLHKCYKKAMLLAWYRQILYDHGNSLPGVKICDNTIPKNQELPFFGWHQMVFFGEGKGAVAIDRDIERTCR